MLKTPLRFFLIAVMLFLQVGISYSQTSCPYDYNEDLWNYNVCYIFEPFYYTMGSVSYHYKDEGNKRKIVVDWNYLYNGSDLKESTIKGLLTFFIRRECGFLNSDGVKEISFYQQVECSVSLSCKLKVDENQEVVCCDAGFEGDPGIYELNGTKYLEATHPLSCGYKCCEKIYSYTCIYNDITQAYDVIFNGTTNNSLTDCDNSQTYYDCKTGLPKSCSGSCP